MADTEISLAPVNKMIVINAAPSKVWDALTNPELMEQWMSETEIDIITDWQVGNSITIEGAWYKTRFENKGIVLQFEPEHILQYSHLSSLSRLQDKTENYSVISFKLTPTENQTTLALTLSNFPTEIICKHLIFYWNVTLEILKKQAEQ